jgi:O-methyltransferase
MKLLNRISRRLALARLSSTSRAVLADKLTYLSPEKIRRLERAVRAVKTGETPGDIVEFGVALGGSGIILARLAGSSRRYFGLDVFDMIPAPTSEKDDAVSKQRYEVIAAGGSRGIGGDTYYGYKQDLLKEVEASFARHQVPVDGRRAILVQGLFEETWSQLPIDEVALAHIDCDWYDPVRFSLNAVADKLAPSGVIVVDDYHAYGGCRAAVDEFLVERRNFIMQPGANPILQKERVP